MPSRRPGSLLLPSTVCALLLACAHTHATSAAASAELTVSSPARSSLLGAGDPVPAFRALAHDGRTIDIAPGTRRDALVIFFYPRDGTPG